MEYLSNNRGRNCLDKWFNQKLSSSHMSRKWINVMILIFLVQYTVHLNVVQNVMHYHISHRGQGQSINSGSKSR